MASKGLILIGNIQQSQNAAAVIEAFVALVETANGDDWAACNTKHNVVLTSKLPITTLCLCIIQFFTTSLQRIIFLIEVLLSLVYSRKLDF
jgi:hypothetical protein